jgi:hypothetical protein
MLPELQPDGAPVEDPYTAEAIAGEGHACVPPVPPDCGSGRALKENPSLHRVAKRVHARYGRFDSALRRRAAKKPTVTEA